jgi:hypothetical protein
VLKDEHNSPHVEPRWRKRVILLSTTANEEGVRASGAGKRSGTRVRPRAGRLRMVGARGVVATPAEPSETDAARGCFAGLSDARAVGGAGTEVVATETLAEGGCTHASRTHAYWIAEWVVAAAYVAAGAAVPRIARGVSATGASTCSRGSARSGRAACPGATACSDDATRSGNAACSGCATRPGIADAASSAACCTRGAGSSRCPAGTTSRGSSRATSARRAAGPTSARHAAGSAGRVFLRGIASTRDDHASNRARAHQQFSISHSTSVNDRAFHGCRPLATRSDPAAHATRERIR